MKSLSQSRFLIGCRVVALWALAVGTAGAAPSTWSGAGGDNNWSTGANWGGTAPVSGNTTVIAFANNSPARTSPNLDSGSAFTINEMTFASGTVSLDQTFTTGSTLTLDANSTGATLATPSGIRDSSANTQTIEYAINVADSQVGTTFIDSSAGSLVLNGNVTATSAVTFEADGASSSITLNGIEGGAGTTSYIGNSTAGTITLAGSSANANSGTTTADKAVTLVLAKTGGVVAVLTNHLFIQGASTVQLNGNGEMGTAVDVQFNGAAGTAGTGAVKMQNNTDTIKGITVSNAATATIDFGTSGTGLLTVSNGSFDTVTVSGGTLNLTGTGTLSAAGNGTTTGITLTGGAVTEGANVVIAGAGAFTQNITGTSTLSGLNTYTGVTNIKGGTLSINTIANAGAASSLGAPTTNATILITFGSGTLQYTGGGNSSSRPFTIGTANGGAATIDASGSGTLTLTGNISDTAATGTGHNTALSLIGSGVGSEGGIIANNATANNTSSVTKNGTGTWTLSGSNTYAGLTTVENGTLIAGIASLSVTNGAFGNASSAIALGDATSITSNLSPSLLIGGAFNVGRNITVGNSNTSTSGVYTLGGSTASSSTFSGAETLNQSLSVTQVTSGTLNLTGNVTSGASGTQTLKFNNVGAVSQSSASVIGAGTGTIAVSQTGAGTTTLAGVNTYSGGTTISAGTLVATNTSGSATGTGALSVLRSGAALAGTGTSSGSSFAIGGTTGSGTANIYVGQTAASGDTNVTNNLTLIGSGASTIANANLTFNLNTNSTPGLAGQGNELVVGSTAITFGSGTPGTNPVTLTLNLQGNGTGGSVPYYVLIAGNVAPGPPSLATTQYAGLSFGTPFAADGGLLTPINNSSVGGSGNLILALNLNSAPNFYGGQSGLYLFQTSGGLDDIVVIPEPGTWALMLGGLAVLVFWQRRKSRA